MVTLHEVYGLGSMTNRNLKGTKPKIRRKASEKSFSNLKRTLSIEVGTGISVSNILINLAQTCSERVHF